MFRDPYHGRHHRRDQGAGGLWLGDTENKTLVSQLLADLVDRGLSADDGLLVVIDRAKALAAAVGKVFGDQALVQRCTLHKRRNVADHLPHDQRGWGRPALGSGLQPLRS